MHAQITSFDALALPEKEILAIVKQVARGISASIRSETFHSYTAKNTFFRVTLLLITVMKKNACVYLSA